MSSSQKPPIFEAPAPFAPPGANPWRPIAEYMPDQGSVIARFVKTGEIITVDADDLEKFPALASKIEAYMFAPTPEDPRWTASSLELPAQNGLYLTIYNRVGESNALALLDWRNDCFCLTEYKNLHNKAPLPDAWMHVTAAVGEAV